MQACVPILREEIQLIKAAGADIIAGRAVDGAAR